MAYAFCAKEAITNSIFSGENEKRLRFPSVNQQRPFGLEGLQLRGVPKPAAGIRFG
jgi:hypothetical protein